MSTAEAEMIVLMGAFQEQKAVHKLFKDIRHSKESWKTHCDNQLSITIAHDPGYCGRAKHTALRFLAIQDVVKRRSIKLFYCPSGKNVADMFTNTLSKEAHRLASSKFSMTARQ